MICERQSKRSSHYIRMRRAVETAKKKKQCGKQHGEVKGSTKQGTI